MPIQPNTIPYAQASSSEVVFLCLLTFSIPEVPGTPPLYVVNNTVDIVSRGVLYSAYPFNIILPEDQPDKLPSVRIDIDNVDRSILNWIRGFSVAPTLKLEVITNVNYNIVERSIGFLKLSSVDYDALTIRATLNVDNILSRRFPADDYDPAQFPGLYSI